LGGPKGPARSGLYGGRLKGHEAHRVKRWAVAVVGGLVRLGVAVGGDRAGPAFRPRELVTYQGGAGGGRNTEGGRRGDTGTNQSTTGEGRGWGPGKGANSRGSVGKRSGRGFGPDLYSPDRGQGQR